MRRECSFCQNQNPIITYSQPPDWRACSECGILILKLDWDMLRNRMVNLHILRHGAEVDVLGVEPVEAMYAALIQKFQIKRGEVR